MWIYSEHIKVPRKNRCFTINPSKNKYFQLMMMMFFFFLSLLYFGWLLFGFGVCSKNKEELACFVERREWVSEWMGEWYEWVRESGKNVYNIIIKKDISSPQSSSSPFLVCPLVVVVSSGVDFFNSVVAVDSMYGWYWWWSSCCCC